MTKREVSAFALNTSEAVTESECGRQKSSSVAVVMSA